MATLPVSPTRVEPTVVAPKSTHTATVFFVHVSAHDLVQVSTPYSHNLQGLGQNNEDWVPVLRKVMDRHPGVKWILPQA